MLTEKQRECLQFIESYLLANEGVSPSFQEIANGLLLDNKGNAHRLIKALEERGFIRRLSNRSRSIEVIRETPANTIPIYDADTLQIRGYLS